MKEILKCPKCQSIPHTVQTGCVAFMMCKDKDGICFKGGEVIVKNKRFIEAFDEIIDCWNNSVINYKYNKS